MTRSLPLFAFALVAFGCSSSAGGTAGAGGEAGAGGAGQTGGAGGGELGGAGGQGGEVGGSGGSGGTGGAGGSGGSGAPYPTATTEALATLSGDITWTVTFDDAAKANGATDCSYTRHYEAVEDRSAPWFCPSCEVVFRADVEMTAGQADCFTQISSAEPLTREWVGYGQGVWYRGVGGAMTEQGTATDLGGSIGIENQVLDLMLTAGGTFQFDVAGSVAVGSAQGDPMNGFTPPAVSACGWPKANPPAHVGPWTMSVGGTMPDGWFLDGCGEPVRLHDFAGKYLVIDMSAIDCPACQVMAGDEEAFLEDMAAAGIEVEMITLLAPSLSDVLGATTKTQLNAWKNKFGLASPVLADRGWGLSMFEPIFGAPSSYPSWAVVSPSLEVLEVGQGFGTFADIADVITADAP